jgi:GH15 family glucan-1,4-alpha-glucosidase
MSAIANLTETFAFATELAAFQSIPSRRVQPYRPLRDYALIGDCHGSALVCRDGSIDWACLGRFDAEPTFAGLLDREHGGFFSIAPAEAARSRIRYVGETAVLATEFETESGRAVIIDFMPVRPRTADGRDRTRLEAPGWIVRLVRGMGGHMRFRLHYAPIPGFFWRAAPLRLADGMVRGDALPSLAGDVDFSLEGGRATATFEVGSGETRAFLVAAGSPRNFDLRVAESALETTWAFWEDWIGACRYEGRHEREVRRSAITLKLLAYAPTGAVVAAPTTSLPEWVGNVRNWDYRFCWLRDSSLTLYALAALGYMAEAHDYVGYLRERHFRQRGIRLVYGIAGETEIEEREVTGFAGYRGSRPVRVGNNCYKQEQFDMFGEALDLALLYRELGGEFSRDEEAALAFVADEAARRWPDPDNGMWEIRGEKRHFVHSKLMCCVAVDRALRLFGEKPAWRRAREEILTAVHKHGLDRKDGHLKQAFGYNGTDASLLIAPWLGLPLDPSIYRSTTGAALRELREGDYLRRYVIPDGLPGREGAFLMSSFRLADAVLHLGDVQAAEQIFAGLLDKASPTGLFSEEIDPGNGELLGNYPQAFVHLAVINTALRLSLFHQYGRGALEGTHADRVLRHLNGLRC